MLLHEGDRLVTPVKIGWQLAQLDQQALTQIAGRDTGWIEGLDAMQNRLDLLHLDVRVVTAGNNIL